MKITLISSTREVKIVDQENDMVLLILSIFGVGWIKLFIDGRISSAIINILLMYTGIGSLIHGIYLSLKQDKFISELIAKGYRPATQEDKEAIKRLIGIDIECASN